MSRSIYARAFETALSEVRVLCAHCKSPIGVVHICTISFWRFKNISQTNFSIQYYCSFSCLAYRFAFRFFWCCCYFFFISSHFRDYIHTMECLLSACAQVALSLSIPFSFTLRPHSFSFAHFIRFVSFYVLNIALISFRCGFSLFNIFVPWRAGVLDFSDDVFFFLFCCSSFIYFFVHSFDSYVHEWQILWSA